MMVMFVGLRSKMIGSWLSYEMWDIRSINMIYVDNLGPPGLGEALPKFWLTFIWELYKKKLHVFLYTKS